MKFQSWGRGQGGGNFVFPRIGYSWDFEHKIFSLKLGPASQIVVKGVLPLFAVCSSVCCFEKCFKCGTWVQHATRMLHYSASHHFFAMCSTYLIFELDFSCNGPNSEGKESGQEVEW